MTVHATRVLILAALLLSCLTACQERVISSDYGPAAAAYHPSPTGSFNLVGKDSDYTYLKRDADFSYRPHNAKRNDE